MNAYRTHLFGLLVILLLPSVVSTSARAANLSFVTAPINLETTLHHDVTFEFVNNYTWIDLWVVIEDAFVSPQFNFVLPTISSSITLDGVSSSSGFSSTFGPADSRDYILRFPILTDYFVGQQIVLAQGTHLASSFNGAQAMINGEHSLFLEDGSGNLVAVEIPSVPLPAAAYLLLPAVLVALGKRRA